MTLARRTDNVSDAESRKRAIDEQLSHAREVFTKLARGEYGGAPQPLHGTVSLSGAGTLLPSPRAILVEERRWHQKAMSLQPPGLSISASTPDLFGDDASSLRKPSVDTLPSVVPRNARKHTHGGVVSSSLDNAELTRALQPPPEPHGRAGGAMMPKLKLHELDRAGRLIERAGGRESRKMRPGMTLEDVTRLGRDAAAAVALHNAYGPGPPAHIQPQAKAHFFRVPHRQPRWESERTRDFKAPYAERGPHAAPAAQRSLPSLTQDAVHFWDAVQLPRGDGPIRLPPTPAQFRKPYPPPVSLDPAAPTQQQHHKHKHKGQTQPHQQVQQRPSAEASAPAVMGVVRSPRGGGGGSGGGSAVEEETVRADLIGKPAMAPPLAHQVLIRGGTAAPFRKGRRVPLAAFDLTAEHPPLPAPAFSRWFGADGSWSWRRCTALDFDPACGRFLIQWDRAQPQPDDAPFRVSQLEAGLTPDKPRPPITEEDLRAVLRINLRFDVEDVQLHANETAFHLQQREQAARTEEFTKAVFQAAKHASEALVDRGAIAIPAWAWQSLPGVMARIGEPHSATMMDFGMKETDDGPAVALLTEQASLHAWYQAIREGLDAQRPPPNTHHGTGTVLPGGGFPELHAAGVVSGYTVVKHVERYAETWLQSSPLLVQMLHGFRSHALEFVEVDVLTQVTSVYELNRVVGIQMQHLYRAVILHNEAMVVLKAEVRRVVAENEHLLGSAVEVDTFKRFLRQTWLMLDDSLITMLHRSLGLYLSSFPKIMNDDTVADRVQHAYDKSENTMLIRMTIVWNGSFGSLEYDPPLSDYEQLANAVLDETRLTLWELQVLDINGTDVVAVELPPEGRGMLAAVCEPALAATHRHISHVVSRSAAMLQAAVANLSREQFLQPGEHSEALTYKPGMDLNAFLQNVESCNQGLLKALNEMHENVYGLFVVDLSSILHMAEGASLQLRHSAYTSLSSHWQTGITALRERLDVHFQLDWDKLDDIEPDPFADLRTFLDSFDEEDKKLTALAADCEEMVATLIKGRIELRDDLLLDHYTTLKRHSQLRTQADELRPRMDDLMRMCEQKLLDRQLRLKAHLREIMGNVDFDMYRQTADVENKAESLAEALQQSLNDVKSDASAIEVTIRQQQMLYLMVNEELREDLVETVTHIEPLTRLWSTASSWKDEIHLWCVTPFKQLDMGRFKASLTEFVDTIASLKHISENLSDVDALAIMAADGPRKVLQMLHSHSNAVKRYLEILLKLRHPGMRERHWMQFFALFEAFDLDLERPATDLGLGRGLFARAHASNLDFMLPSLLLLPLHKVLTQTQTIVDQAVYEYEVELALNQMEKQLKDVVWRAEPHKLHADMNTIGGVPAMLSQVEDQLVVVEKLLGRPNAPTIEARALNRQSTLARAVHAMQLLISFQEAYQFLWPVLRNKTVRESLPDAIRQFADVEDAWAFVYDWVAMKIPAMMVCDNQQIVERLAECNVNMDTILNQVVKSLNTRHGKREYGRRMRFGRFFFLSDTEILELLGGLSQLSHLQHILCKCFSVDVVELRLDDKTPFPSVLGLRGLRGERFDLDVEVPTEGVHVEEWLKRIVLSTRACSQARLTTCMEELFEGWWQPPKPLLEEEILAEQYAASVASADVEEFASASGRADTPKTRLRHTTFLQKVVAAEGSTSMQMCLLAHQRLFTFHAEAAIEAGNPDLHAFVDIVRGQLKQLVAFIQTNYQLDTLARLMAHPGTLKVSDPEWQRCLRFYTEPMPGRAFRHRSLCHARMMDYTIDHDFEYLGSNERLVMTPLTERCHLATFHAFKMHLASAFVGPASSGKTEIAKDLSTALGKFSVVFNCTEAIDLTCLGNVMKGMATTGAWLLLDNFHAMRPVVTSTLAMQALALRTALLQGKTEVMLDGMLLSPIEKSFGMHVTSTPRLDSTHPLPEDLKVLFRATVLAVPDADFICRALIQAQGFENVDTLKRKLVSFFKLAAGLLQSDPRRFGLHGMKVCVRMMAAGAWQLPKVAPEPAPTPRQADVLEQPVEPKPRRASHAPDYPPPQLARRTSVMLRERAARRSSMYGMPPPPVKKRLSIHELESVKRSKEAEADAASRERASMMEDGELNLLLRVLRAYSEPVAIGDDASILKGILLDLFPGLTLQPWANSDPGSFADVVKAAMEAAGLGMDRTETLTKCLELKEAMQTHRGVLLVGPSGVGKTTCYTVLAAALESTAKAIQSKENLHHHHQNRGHLSSPAIKSLMQMGGTGKIQLSVISPRAVALRHLYGSHDNQSNQWEDGILSSVMRRGAAQHATQHPTWLVMDGEMTSSWVEGLHSALDSTSQFCLDNGERIKLPPIGHMNLLFEDVTLSHASPSLVGRCGVVCFKQAVEWWPLVETAIRDLPSHLRTHGKMLLNLYQTVFSGALEAVQAAGGSDMAVTQCHLHLMRALLLLAPIGEAEMGQTLVEEVSPEKLPAGRRRRDSTAILMEQLGLTELIEVPGSKSRAVRKVAHPNGKYMVGADGANSLVLLGVLSEGGFQAARQQLHAELAAYHDTLRPQDAEVTEEPEEESGIADTAVSSSKPVPSFDRFTPTPDTSPDKKTRRSVKDLRGEYVPHEEEDVPVETVVCQMFLFALTWTVGANLNRESRKVFDTWLLRFCAGDSQHSRDLSSALPPGSVWDYSLDVRSHRWMQWEQCIAPTMYDCDRLESMPLVYPDHRIHAADLWIPSTEALASATIVQVLVSTKFPVILHGPSGSGKTAIMHHALKRLREDEGYLPLEFRLRRKSTAEGLKGGVSENLEHRRKNLLGPPNGQRMALFVDDLNLHARSSSIPELLRSFLEQRGWHPLQKTTFHRVEDVHLLACSDRLDTRIGGAGHRLQRHFLAMKNDELDALTLASITQTLLAMRFSAPNQLQFWYELDAVSSMALEVWSTAAKHFLVTPASPHYTFDVSTYFSIIQAVLFADAAHVLDVRGRLPRLLVHESLRCIGDRLSSEEDRQWLQRSLVTVAERHFNSFRMDVAQLSELHFGDCELEAGYADTDMRLFAQRTYASAREVAQKQGLRFPVGFVLFQEASSQLLRILRVLREPQGHLLLGERGVGKRTVAALALHMSGMAVFECQAPTSKMDSAEVASCLAATRSRVWEATNVAALDDKHVVVYLTMDDLSLPSSQALLDDVQQLLSLGEIPEQVTAELRHEARSRVLEIFKVKMQKRAEVDPNTRPASKSKGGTSSQADSHQPTLSEQLDMVKMRVSTSASFRSSDPMYNRYVTSLRSKLHVVCVVDVDDDKRALRQSLCANPSLLKCCAVDWFGPWSEAAFKSVAQAHFDLDPELLADAQLSVVDMERVVSCLAHVHCTTLGMARQLTCAPASTPEIQLGLPDSSVNNTAKAAVWASRTSVLAYTELVLGFKQNLRSRRAHLSSKIELLETSIDASQSLMAEMETMEEQVADVGEVLAEAKTELDTVNQSIEEEAARVRSEEASILAKADEIAAEAKEAMALADAARAALDAAMPELERAQTLLGSITKQDIAELKGFRVPPESMMLTVEALCIVLGIAPKRVEASKASKKVSKGPRTPRSTGASTDNSPRSLLSTPRSMSNSGSATGLAQLASESEAVESAEAASGTTVETAEDGAVTPSADKKSPSKKKGKGKKFRAAASAISTALGQSKTSSPNDATDRCQQAFTKGESGVPELGQMNAARVESPEVSDTDSLTPRVARDRPDVPKLVVPEGLEASAESREVTPLQSNRSKPPLPPLARAADLLTQKPATVLKRLSIKKSFVDDYWLAAKEQLFSDKKFLERLTGFDTADITPEIISQLEPYIANEQFESDAVAHVSIACMSICIWVHAIYNFRTTSELTIDPLKAQLEEAERLLEEKRQAHAAHTKTLSKTKVKLKAMKKKQAVLQQQVDTHDTAIAQRQERKKVAGGVESMLHVWKQQWANTSTLAAGSEHSDEHSDRFQSNAPWCNLQARLATTTGDTLLAASHIAYAGWFDPSQRAKALQLWQDGCTQFDLAASADFRVDKYFVDEDLAEYYAAAGLPAGTHALESVLILEKSLRCPLVYDPQQQTTPWLRKMMSAHLVDSTRTNLNLRPFAPAERYADYVEFSSKDEGLSKVLDGCMAKGNVLLLNLDGGDAHVLQQILRPIVLRPMMTNNRLAPQYTTTVAHDHAATVMHPRFRLIMVLRDGSYYPMVKELGGMLNAVDCSSTASSLSASLLTELLARRAPKADIEKHPQMLGFKQYQSSARAMKERMMQSLLKCEGSPIDDLAFTADVEVYMKTQRLADRKRAVLEEVRATYAEEVAAYARIASQATVQYFCLQQLWQRYPVYYQSFDMFLQSFTSSIASADSGQPAKAKSAGAEEEDRARSVVDSTARILGALYAALTRPLMASHKLLFGFLSIMQGLHGDGAISSAEWRAFAAMDQDIPELAAGDGPSPPYVTSAAWSRLRWLCGEVQELAELVHESCPDGLFKLSAVWSDWIASSTPLEHPLPGKWEATIPAGSFRRLLLVRILMPVSTTAAVQQFVTASLGGRAGDAFDISAAFALSAPLKPLICIHDAAASPVGEIMLLAKRSSMSPVLEYVSLDKSLKAVGEAIRKAADEGRWVVVPMCQVCDALGFEKINRMLEFLRTRDALSASSNRFRIWITTPLQAHGTLLPTSILEHSVRFASEPPKDVRSAIVRTAEELRTDRATGRWFSPLLLHLSLLHCVLTLRGNFGTTGFAQPYHLDHDDFTLGWQLITRVLDDERAAVGEATKSAAVAQTATKSAPSSTRTKLARHVILLENGLPDVATMRESCARRIQFELAEVIYGGRVFDAESRRLIQHYVEQSFCLESSAGGYKNAHPSRTLDADIARAIETYIPVTPTLSHGMRMDSDSWGPDGILQLYFATHLKAALEAEPSPVAVSFGLPEDVTIQFRCNEMQQFIAEIRRVSMQARPGAPEHSPASSSSWHVELLRATADIESLVPEPLDVSQLVAQIALKSATFNQEVATAGSRANTPRQPLAPPSGSAAAPKPRLKMNLGRVMAAVSEIVKQKRVLKAAVTLLPSPLSMLLFNQAAFYNDVLRSVGESLSGLRRVLYGEEQLSEETQSLACALLQNEVPHLWRARCTVSHVRLTSWLRHLNEAVAFFRDWIELDQADAMPPAMHMPAFSSPDRIIAAVIQKQARRTRTPVDMMQVYVHVIPDRDFKDAAPVNGCYLRGVSLEHARFDQELRQLAECPPGTRRTAAPVLWMQPTPLLSADLSAVQRGGLADVVSGAGVFPCPLYRSSARAASQNRVVTVELGVGEYDVEHWMRRGVALVSVVLDEG